MGRAEKSCSPHAQLRDSAAQALGNLSVAPPALWARSLAVDVFELALSVDFQAGARLLEFHQFHSEPRCFAAINIGRPAGLIAFGRFWPAIGPAAA